MSISCFDIEKIGLLQHLIIEATGGVEGIKDENLVLCAIEGIYQTFGGKEIYPTKEEKAARLCYSLISNHAFVDGNKRIGIVAMFLFLQLHGLDLNATNKEIEALGWDVGAGRKTYDDILNFIHQHLVISGQ